jgi:hypothetical protein
MIVAVGQLRRRRYHLSGSRSRVAYVGRRSGPVTHGLHVSHRGSPPRLNLAGHFARTMFYDELQTHVLAIYGAGGLAYASWVL